MSKSDFDRLLGKNVTNQNYKKNLILKVTFLSIQKVILIYYIVF